MSDDLSLKNGYGFNVGRRDSRKGAELAAPNTFTGANTFSGDNTLTGDNTFSGDNAFSGADTHTGLNTFGAGENQEFRTPAGVGRRTIVLDGSEASSTTDPAPTVKISRFQEVTEAATVLAGATPGAQPAQMNCALSVVSEGGTADEMQSTAVFFGASTKSSTDGGNALNDAGAIVAEGRLLSGGTGSANAITAVGRRDVDTGRCTSIELHVGNWTATAGTYNPAGTSDVKGLFIVADGTAAAASAIEVTRQGAQSFKVGIGFGESATGTAVTDSSLLDMGSATTALDIQGTHTQALFVAAGAGIVRLEADAAATQLLSTRVENDTFARLNLRADGRLQFGDGASATDTQIFRAGVGIVRVLSTIEMEEITAPSAPAANRVRLFTQDSAGKTQLMALFPTGVAQQVAIEP